MIDRSHDAEQPVAVLLERDAVDRWRRNDAAIRLLDEWLADESGYDEETWPLLKEALDREREQIGARKLFSS